MRLKNRYMGHAKRDKQRTHERILNVAAKRFRERGLEGIGVVDVMKDAGLTVGGFYKHFESRDELVVEALATAFKDLDVWEEHTTDMAQLLQNYLTEAHRDVPGMGCAMGALLGDMTRGSRSARALYTERVKRSLTFTSALLPSSPRSDKRGRALLILSALLGAINLSRAVSDPDLSREILYGVREQLIGLGEPGVVPRCDS
jgi:TetR/AcrR family transcriptional regulator, transcriptional repressor for nem operon